MDVVANYPSSQQLYRGLCRPDDMLVNEGLEWVRKCLKSVGTPHSKAVTSSRPPEVAQQPQQVAKVWRACQGPAPEGGGVGTMLWPAL